jgi:hypothetical protein
MKNALNKNWAKVTYWGTEILRTSVTENTVQRQHYYDPRYEELMLLTKVV